ncbi:MAG: hypothetical protein LLG01_15290 [Planctomycetaceae bacterium]|nr:hypothetical protein [Planctomycetaceae bacterium]
MAQVNHLATEAIRRSRQASNQIRLVANGTVIAYQAVSNALANQPASGTWANYTISFTNDDLGLITTSPGMDIRGVLMSNLFIIKHNIFELRYL